MEFVLGESPLIHSSLGMRILQIVWFDCLHFISVCLFNAYASKRLSVEKKNCSVVPCTSLFVLLVQALKNSTSGRHRPEFKYTHSHMYCTYIYKAFSKSKRMQLLQILSYKPKARATDFRDTKIWSCKRFTNFLFSCMNSSASSFGE